MRYLDQAEAIWESSGDKNVHAEGSGTVDQDVEGNLHVNKDVNRLEVNGKVKGSVHIHEDAHVTITGNVDESIFADKSSTVIVKGSVKGNIHGSQHVSVSGRVHGDLFK